MIGVPPDHPVYPLELRGRRCERPRTGGTDLCGAPAQLAQDARAGVGKAEFLLAAKPLARPWRGRGDPVPDLPGRPVVQPELRLCAAPSHRWLGHARDLTRPADFGAWLAASGRSRFRLCRCDGVPEPGGLGAGAVRRTSSRYNQDGRPGGAEAARSGAPRHEQHGPRSRSTTPTQQRVPPLVRVTEARSTAPDRSTCAGLRPLLQAEIQWCLFTHTQWSRPAGGPDLACSAWSNRCRGRESTPSSASTWTTAPQLCGGIAKRMLQHLRLVYFTPADTQDAGFIETDHFGVRFPAAPAIDLTGIPQRWLRDLLWDHRDRCGPRPARAPQADRHHPPRVHRTGRFLEPGPPAAATTRRPGRRAHDRFVADQRHREPTASLAGDEAAGRQHVHGHRQTRGWSSTARSVLRAALDSGDAERSAWTGVHHRPARRRRGHRAAAAVPSPTRWPGPWRTRTTCSASPHGRSNDRGLRDIWETIVLTGRRAGEVLKYAGLPRPLRQLPMFWHDQTKVGNFDAASASPNGSTTARCTAGKTVALFVQRHGRPPDLRRTGAIALFPHARPQPCSTVPRYGWFHSRFSAGSMSSTSAVGSRTRPATPWPRTCSPRSDLTHVRRYLGHVSDPMAEHYVHLANTDPENALNASGSAGPAPPTRIPPFRRRADDPREAEAMAIDLTRHTPAEGGFCTFQPVVNGDACPWNLDCHNCDKFVLSGADLIYWRRKREQWRMLAEGAPDDTTADYLHQLFEPTARAIDGLERALAASASSTKPSPSTCADPRTTSAGSGPPPSAPPISPASATARTTRRTSTPGQCPADDDDLELNPRDQGGVARRTGHGQQVDQPGSALIRRSRAGRSVAAAALVSIRGCTLKRGAVA